MGEGFFGRGLSTYVGEASHTCSTAGVVGAMGMDLARKNPWDHFPNSGYTGSTVLMGERV